MEVNTRMTLAVRRCVLYAHRSMRRKFVAVVALERSTKLTDHIDKLTECLDNNEFRGN